MSFAVGPVSVDVRDTDAPFHGKPINDRSGANREGKVRLAKITTPDGLIANVGITCWDDGASELRMVDFVSGPDEYRRLERAGNMGLNDVPNGLLAVLRALKFGERDYAKLETVGWEQLDEWADGDAQALLRELGATAMGTHGELRSAARNFREAPAVVSDPDAPAALFAGYALTRVIPLALDFGRDGVEAMY